MATVKLRTVDGSPRVLTKLVGEERRVSCSCCDDLFCCMYPFQLLAEEILTYEDLPESVDVFTSEGNFVANLSRLDPPLEDGTVLVYYEESGNGYAAQGDGNYISVEEGGDNATVFLGGSIFATSCLLVDDPTFRIQDLFADEYTVTGPVSGTITRQNACLWTGEGLTLRYRSEIFPSGPPYIANVGKWALNGVIKEGFQDSPAGTYGDYEVIE
jgi:hypothetical protein